MVPETYLVICSGFHPPQDTEQMWADMRSVSMGLADQEGLNQKGLNQGWETLKTLVYPARHAPHPAVLSAYHLRRMLTETLGDPQSPLNPSRPRPQLIFLAFSAGCVTAATVAQYWAYRGGEVLALFAVDGWGVPLLGATFPVFRLSHDPWTHVTSALLGVGPTSFYADPPVPHRYLWRQPSQVEGWQVFGKGMGGTIPARSPHATSCPPAPVRTTAARFIHGQLAGILRQTPPTLAETS